MQLGRVVGTVVATAKEATLEGRKFLVVRLVDLEAKETGAYVIAIDAVGAPASVATGGEVEPNAFYDLPELEAPAAQPEVAAA